MPMLVTNRMRMRVWVRGSPLAPRDAGAVCWDGVNCIDHARDILATIRPTNWFATVKLPFVVALGENRNQEIAIDGVDAKKLSCNIGGPDGCRRRRGEG
jgi:hypothetical protein